MSEDKDAIQKYLSTAANGKYIYRGNHISMQNCPKCKKNLQKLGTLEIRFIQK